MRADLINVRVCQGLASYALLMLARQQPAKLMAQPGLHRPQPCYPLDWPVHFLMSVRLLTGHDLMQFLAVAGNQVLSQADAVRPQCNSERAYTV